MVVDKISLIGINSTGTTPLHLAINSQNIKIATFVILQTNNLLAVDIHGQTIKNIVTNEEIRKIIVDKKNVIMENRHKKVLLSSQQQAYDELITPPTPLATKTALSHNTTPPESSETFTLFQYVHRKDNGRWERVEYANTPYRLWDINEKGPSTTYADYGTIITKNDEPTKRKNTLTSSVGRII